jgi:predicted phosphodiesterase
MKIKLVSDLHLEFSDINIQNNDNCDVLILAGDIMVASDLHDHPAADFNPYSQGAFADLGRKQQRVQRFRDFLKRCSFQFPHVIYIMGNHEFYHGRFYDSIEHMREECAKFPNIYMFTTLLCHHQKVDWHECVVLCMICEYVCAGVI